MKKIFIILMALPMIGIGQPKFIFQHSFDAAPIFSSDPTKGFTNWDETCCAWSFTNSDSFKISGKSGRFELRKSDPSPQPNDSKRSQMEWNGAAIPMGATWYAMTIMPAPYSAIDPAPEDLFDLHDRMPGGASSNWTNPFGIWNENGRWKVHITYSVNPIGSPGTPISKYYDCGPVVPGKFVDWVLHTNYSWRDTGFVELYKDGVKVIDYKGPCAYNGAMPDPYFKFGIYKWPWASSSFQPPSTTTLRVFYVENLRIGNRNNTINDFIQTAPANMPPIANAGPDQITAPDATSFTVNGSGTDSDGTISGYLWEIFATPTGWMGTSTNQNWTLTGAAPGSYKIKLTVTDNKGAKGFDTVNVTIPNANRAPVISVPNNDTVRVNIPVASVRLDASATDPDGDAIGYQWLTPAGGIINGMTLSVAFNVAGTYTYKLTATDSKGASSSKMFTIIVNPIPPKLIVDSRVRINPLTGGQIVTIINADGTTREIEE